MFLIGGGSAQGYKTKRSLRFRGSQKLEYTTSAAATSTTTSTLSLWMKVSEFARQRNFFYFGAPGGGGALLSWQLNSADQLQVIFDGAASTGWTSNAVFRDPSAHIHLCVGIDTTQATASNRFTIEINGVDVTANGTYTPMAQNYAFSWNSGNLFSLSTSLSGAGTQFGGYISEFRWIDGQKLSASNFGKFDRTTGAWVPVHYAGTYGLAGGYWDFSDNSAATAAAIGADKSGNGHNLTPTGISVSADSTNDSLTDTPTNYGIDTGVGGEVRGNYATLNPLNANASEVFSNGNLKVVGLNSANTCAATFAMSSGLWYWEAVAGGALNGNVSIGIAPASKSWQSGLLYSSGATSWGLNAGGDFYELDVDIGVFTSYAAGDTLAFALDMNNGKFYVGKISGTTITWMNSGNPLAGTGYLSNNGISGQAIVPACSPFTTSGSFEYNFGQRPWLATNVPTGFKALCTQNLPNPAIKKPSSFFDVNTRVGTGAAFSATGFGFQPDMVWSKSRSTANDHALFDSVRGVQKDFAVGSGGAEVTDTQGLSAFNADGFSGGTLTKLNTSGAAFVDWMWKKGAGRLDIVTYSGDGSTNRNINHNLGVAPAFVVVFDRTTARSQWSWHQKLSGATYMLDMTSTAGQSATGSPWGTGNFSATQFMVSQGGNSINSNAEDYVAFLFAEVEGFSKFGSYTGNGAADGSFVWCGFRPRYVMIKRVDTAGEWTIWDTSRSTYNAMTAELYAHSPSAEVAGSTPVDDLSSGFKLRGLNAYANASGGVYAFMAFAETPFKYARAR